MRFIAAPLGWISITIWMTIRVGTASFTWITTQVLIRTFSPALNHYFVRGYFKLMVPDLCATPIVQRKLLYFKPQGWGVQPNRWQWVLTAFPWGTNCASDGYNLTVAEGEYGNGLLLWGDSPSSGFDTAHNHIYNNTWYYLEVEVIYGAYHNDTVRIWLGRAGTVPYLILDRSDLYIRSPDDVAGNIGLETIEIGRQVDIGRTSFSQGIDEHRYWDEIAISTTSIGPIDGSGGDTGGGGDTALSGGDSTSSGGSGCGFVKSDGKGQGAKGEGLSLMIMLIVTLAGIALVRKAAKA